MQPQVNNQNITPETPSTPARVERGEGSQHDKLAGVQPERQTAPAAERGASQPSGLSASAQPSAPQLVVNTPAATPATSVGAFIQVQPALTTAGGDKLEKPWVDRADEIIQTKAQDPYAEEEAHEELSAQYLKQRFNLDIKRSTPQQ